MNKEFGMMIRMIRKKLSLIYANRHRNANSTEAPPDS